MSVSIYFILLLLLPSVTAAFLATFPPIPPATMPATTTVLLSQQLSRGQVNLVDKLRREGVINHQQVIAVMKQVDRKNYIDYDPYWDSPQSIECGQTISAPHMHAWAMEEMLPSLLNSQSESLKMLDVGCGSGYLTATMGRWVKPKSGEEPILHKSGKVYGIDIFPRLVEMTRQNLMKEDGDLLESGTVELKQADGWKGWPEHAPYDAIHVGAAADSFPTKLANQLAVGGVMVIPIGPDGGVQYFYRVHRVAETGNVDKDFQTTRLIGVRYVPLIKEFE
jgi:protein-L-isoaspartate(D-aspartate) O-methyltransferase